MIRVVFFRREDSSLLGYEFEGHAEAGEYGYDIVCSAVSALAINTANSIELLTGAGVQEEAAADGGYLKVMLNPQSADDAGAQLLMRSLELGISQMAGSYPDNLTVRQIPAGTRGSFKTARELT